MKSFLSKIAILSFILLGLFSTILPLVETIPIAYAEGVEDSISATEALKLGGDFSCGWSNWTGCIFTAIYTYLYLPSAIVAYFGGYILDTFINVSISSSSYTNSDFVLKGWGIVRDFTNFAFIFSLLGIAIATVLGTDKSSYKKGVMYVILAALVVNFSLALTRGIIDLSNIAARVFVDNIQVTSQDDAAGIKEGSTLDKDTKFVSLAILAKMNPQMILGQAAKGHGSGGKLLLYISIILFSAAGNYMMGFVFAVIASMFLLRVVQLWFSMILSPIAIASFAMPASIKKNLPAEIQWDSWIKTVVNNSILAPVFLFFLYLIIVFLNTDILSGL